MSNPGGMLGPLVIERMPAGDRLVLSLGFSLRRRPAQVQRVFEVTGLVDRLPFED
jgi:hypothetical protein